MSSENPASIEPYDSGLLDVGDGNRVYWEQVGSPTGIPVLRVHGGPGSGFSERARRAFDPGRFRAILFDQRNCGRSLPHASDPAVDLNENTTAHLITDMERLREHLEIEQWFLHGGSWASTLILAYAETHPERVLGLIVHAVTTTRRSETAWLYEGVGRIFPEAQQRFREHIPAEERGEDVFGLLAAYGRQMRDPDPEVRARTSAEWLAWEDAVISGEVNGSPGAYSKRPDDAKLAFVRICAHYFSQGGFLEDGQILRDAWKLAGIPGALLHGRFDLGCPLITPYELAKAWPDAELVVGEDAGHTGSAAMRALEEAAYERVFRLGAARMSGSRTS